MGKKIDDLNPILSKITRPVAAIKSLRFALFSFAKSSFSYRGSVSVGLSNIFPIAKAFATEAQRYHCKYNFTAARFILLP